MKKLVLFMILMLSFSVMALAQDTPAAEIFGGYSFVHVKPLHAGDVNNINLNGWTGSLAVNGNKWAGFVADFGGYYGTAREAIDDTSGTHTDVWVHTFMFGPRITGRLGKATPFVQALFGAARLTAKGVGVPHSTDNVFAMAFGGGVDVNINDMFAVRAGQAEFFTAKDASTGDFLKNARFSAGIVVKLGKR